jgi:hypothetical protein
MKELRVPVRDTYCHTNNFDDFYTNGNRYNGSRLLKIEWVETEGFPAMSADQIYQIPSYQSAAYDAYSIVMPNRYKIMGRDDPIIHELVHFLQHNSTEEDSRYIKFTGQNYSEYLGQRVELEAHAVQVLYILREHPTHRDKHLTFQEQELMNCTLLNIVNGDDLCNAIPALLLCKERRLI